MATVITQIVCETLKLSPDLVIVEAPDTHRTPNAGTTTASRQTLLTGEATLRAAKLLKAELDAGKTLADLEVGDSTHIRRIVEDYSLMDYLQSKNISIDMEVTVKNKEPYEGPILLETEKGDISLSYKAAQQIYVDENK